MATICLNMIVKNEAGVIRRCLESVKDLIDYWVIVDTGSTDGTQELIRTALADVPGELHERPWKDFGHNRTEALALARDKADYSLIIDADEILIRAPSFRMPKLVADAYMTVHQAGESGTSFYLTQLVKNSLPWRYVGVLHEVITCDEKHVDEKLEGLVCKGFFDSGRNRDPQAKYQSDARVLEAALEKEPDNARYVFYLAQSYRDSGDLDRAIETYQRRAEMGGWPEEVWYSLFQIAVLSEKKAGPFAPALEAYLRAFQYRPTRAEPLCELARHFRQKNEHATAYVFASRAAELPRPNDILFLDHTVYDWRALDELAVSAYYVGRPRDALAAADRLLSEGLLPAGERARVEANREFSRNVVGDEARRERNRRKGRR